MYVRGIGHDMLTQNKMIHFFSACLLARIVKVYAVGQNTVAVGPDLHPCEDAEHNAGKLEKFSYQMFK